ncbi:MAG: acetate--CoA ligase family protein [Actinobacteria bacterium]|nr:acetate--CoA ligase family protein [Actinomycetota bacterium]
MASSLDTFFNPETIAVVGVSEKPGNLGRVISGNLQSFGFRGIVYEVGPNGGTLYGRRIYKAVSDIPDRVDLAVLLVPARVVPDAMAECGRKGIRHVVVETAGFSESGPEGAELEQRVAAIAAEHGIRFIGPNCIGLVNRHAGLSTAFVSLDAHLQPGGTSVVTQSGGVGISILNMLASEGGGLAKMVSVGNKVDVDENDVLEYLIDDPETEIITMYLEGIRDGKRLMDLARSTDKPILIHKSNIGEAARGIASSHTAALSADDAVVDAALRQAGIARFRDSETLVHYLKALALPPMRGNRVAVLSRSGGHAVIAADACELEGLELATLPQDFLDEAQTHLRANVISLTNPMDLGDLFDLDVYEKLASGTLAMDGVDGMVFMHTYMVGPDGDRSQRLFERLHEMSLELHKPVAVHADTVAGEVSRLKQVLPGPVFQEPSDAVRALALLRDYWKADVLPPERPDGPADAGAVRAILAACRAEGRDPLLQEAMAIAAAYGVPAAECRLAASEDEAVAAAEDLGLPVVLKVVSPEISHKSDFGGVQLNLRSEDGVRAAYREIMAEVGERAPEANLYGVVVQPMLRGGRDLIVGARLDPNFGHVVLVGMGGVFVEVFRDAAIRVAPFPRPAAEAMLRELKVWPVLKGVRGQEASDVDALVEVILAIARLVTDFPEIAELDLNPIRVMAAGHGCRALDARMSLVPGA